MRVVILANASSVHTVKWANGLSRAGNDVHVISQHPVNEEFSKSVHLYILPYRGVLGYFLMVRKVRSIIKLIGPDIVNAHYASGYGTTAHLVGHRPWILSVWGSDVFEFPYKSYFHKRLVCSNLLAADAVASTSVVMANQTRSLAPKLKDIAITPFGVDTNYYKSLVTPLLELTKKKNIVIGTVKTLSPKYGIDTLIKSFAMLLSDFEKIHSPLKEKLSLRLVGTGPDELKLKSLVKELKISNNVCFVGRVDSCNVPKELNVFDIYVALSRQESFGVAVIEAGAAGRPVVVSDAGGLPEVVINGETGFVVAKENPQAAVDAIAKLVLDHDLRIRMGEAGRQHVEALYDWNVCINTMINLYKRVI